MKNIFKKGQIPWNKGLKGYKFKVKRKTTEKTRKILSEAKLRNPVRYWKGKKMSEEHKRKLSESHIGKYSGENHPNWKGGITPVNVKLRNSIEAKLWRKAVFERDKFTCRFCYQVGGKLEADHIKRWSDYPELRFAIDNGRTLCFKCHTKTDTYGNKK